MKVYAGLGVQEVWRWKRGRLTVLALSGRRYVTRKRSALLPELDFALFERFLGRPDQTRAAEDYRAALLRARR